MHAYGSLVGSEQQRNLGHGVCLLRLAVGAALLLAAFFVHGAWLLIAVPGVLLYLWGALRYCPAFMPDEDGGHCEETRSRP